MFNVLACLGRSFFTTVFLLMLVQWPSRIMSMALQWNPDKVDHSLQGEKSHNVDQQIEAS